MPDLLLHSMAEFTGIVLPALEIAGARDIVEVGSEYGTMTRQLLQHAGRTGGHLTSIDPDPKPDAREFFAKEPGAELIEAVSLEALSELSADAYVVDGDHNYYTVRNESELMWEAANKRGTPFLAFYHDVGWPCARRDLYYAPDRIPEDARHPHSWDLGVTLGEPAAFDGGFRGAGQFALALGEGGTRNGVLTAIEDFVEGKEERLCWAFVPAVFGLGILFERNAPWSRSMEAFLLPYHENPLLARLERNRLDCYLRIIAMQDANNARVA